MTNYRDIQTLEDLDRAISENRYALESKKLQISRSYDNVRSFYTPGNLISQGARRLGYAVPAGELILMAIGRIRRRLRK